MLPSRNRLSFCITTVSYTHLDLYAQFHVLDWRILGYKTYWSFAANHIEFDPEIPQKIIRCLNTDYLARKISRCV